MTWTLFLVFLAISQLYNYKFRHAAVHIRALSCWDCTIRGASFWNRLLCVSGRKGKRATHLHRSKKTDAAPWAKCLNNSLLAETIAGSENVLMCFFPAIYQNLRAEKYYTRVNYV